MRKTADRRMALAFIQLVAAASLGCGGQASSSPPTGSDASTPTDSGADSGEDAGMVIGCGGCGCGDASDWIVTLDGGLDASGDAALPCNTLCLTPGRSAAFCTLLDASAPASISCTPEPCLGRRPEGLRARSAAPTGCRAGAYFAEMAQLEAASVPAFRRVARELAAFGAPRRLVRAAERAARDEIRHARAARSLARSHGAVDAPFEAPASSRRSLETFAVENAVEGCVRETYGALVATWQAHNASDRSMRGHFARIAHDETNHAALAARIDRWARARLDRAARQRIAAQEQQARLDLRIALERYTPDPTFARAAGLPPRSVALALAAGLEARRG